MSNKCGDLTTKDHNIMMRLILRYAWKVGYTEIRVCR